MFSMLEKTFSLLKPDATRRNLIGKIDAIIENNGFKIVAIKMLHISIEKAQGFYMVHKDRPFFNELTNYISSAPIVVQVLAKENAIADYRKMMGATNPASAEEGTIRQMYGLSISENTVHGSDSIDSASYEISYFFSNDEIFD